MRIMHIHYYNNNHSNHRYCKKGRTITIWSINNNLPIIITKVVMDALNNNNKNNKALPQTFKDKRIKKMINKNASRLLMTVQP